MSTDPIAIALAADRNFVRQLAVVLTSLSEAAVPGRDHEVFVLHDGYDASLMARVESCTSSSLRLSWVDVRTSEMLSAHLPPWMPTSTLYRLRIAEVIPERHDRVIYIDTDTFVCDSLEALWTVELEDSLLAAVGDAERPWFALALDWRSLELDPTTPYFNAGILVIPTKKWREDQVAAKALDLLTRYELKLADQCALNVIAAGAWTRLAPRWNVQSQFLQDDCGAWASEPVSELDVALRDPGIVHLCHGRWRRPWEPNPNHPYSEEWARLLDQTPWRGWRPDHRGRVAAAAMRVKKATSVLRYGSAAG